MKAIIAIPKKFRNAPVSMPYRAALLSYAIGVAYIPDAAASPPISSTYPDKFSGENLDIISNGYEQAAIYAAWGGSVSISKSKISTTNLIANGVESRQTSFVNLTDTTIRTSKNGAYGIASSNSSVNLFGAVSINTEGRQHIDSNFNMRGAHGIVAENVGDVYLNDSSSISVATSGNHAVGLLAQSSGSSIHGSSTARLAIQTSGDYAPGMQAYNGGAINVTRAIIKTTGYSAPGAAVFEGGRIESSFGSITTAGESAHGLLSYRDAAIGPGTVQQQIIFSHGSITTSGKYSAGVYSFGPGSIQVIHSSSRTSGESAYASASIGTGSVISLTNGGYYVSQGINSASAYIADGGSVIADGGIFTSWGINSFGIKLTGGSDANPNRFSGNDVTIFGTQGESIRADGATANIALTGRSKIGLSDTGNLLVRAVARDGIGSKISITVDALDTDGATLFGDILADRASNVNLRLGKLSTWTGSVQNGGNFNVSGSGHWNLTNSSDLASLQLNDGGTVEFIRTPWLGYFALTAGSLGGTGGTIGMNAVLNEGGVATQSDQLHVTGNVSGKHRLAVTNQDGAGARTVGDGIKLVQVDGQSAADNFTLATPVQAGAYEYRLFQGGSDSVASWYLRSDLADEQTVARAVNTDSTTAQKTGATSSVVGAAGDIGAQSARKLGDLGDYAAYRTAVPGYALTPALNLNYGFTTIGRLHERVGDIQSLEQGGNVSGKDGVWGRIGGNNLDADSGRFQAKQNDFFAQFGKDWEIERDGTGGHRHTGATLTLGNSNGRFEDSARAIDPRLSTRTGSVDTQAQALGGYYTQYWGDGSYFDGVGQVTRFSNKYSDSYGAKGKQDGYAIGISGEVGKPFVVASNGFTVEPQAQLMYQYLNLDDFNDQISSVRMDSQDQLRGRIGVRLFKTTPAGQKSDFTRCATVDVLHDFLSAGTTWVGSTGFERGFAKTWYELGLGMSGALSKNSEVYANVKYAQNIGGDSMRNVSGAVGYRYNW